MKNLNEQTIWIIGTSSGIGRATASALHQAGASLILSARRKDKLDALNRALGNQHQVCPLDISDTQALSTTTHQLFSEKNIDCVMHFAAAYTPTVIKDLDLEESKLIVSTNLLSVISLTNLVLPHFENQQAGRLVLCASVAGFVGLPGGQPYSATKAAVINFAESLRAEVPNYITIQVINPGFVKTDLTAKNDFPMPMQISPEKAAEAIVVGLQSKQFEIHFPRRFTWLVKFLRALPYAILLKITRKMHK